MQAMGLMPTATLKKVPIPIIMNNLGKASEY